MTSNGLVLEQYKIIFVEDQVGLIKINNNMPVEHKLLALASWLQKIS
jgi:hypothetical protein